MSAQKSDGFFRGNDEIVYDNRTDGVGLEPAQQENPTPLGNGLFVMLAVGVSYVTLKKKKDNTKTLNVALLAMILLFTQCKKANVPSVIDDGVYITLNAGYDGKTVFTPSSGEFVWSYGVTEYIYVGGNAHSSCLGVLSGTGTGTSNMTFSGTLTTTPNNGETLYFFYLGKGRNGSAVTTLDFSNQDGTLENVTRFHVAIGEGSYTSGTVNYATYLAMKMAIAYFDVSEFQNINETAEIVYLHGSDVYSKATVNYQTGTITGSTKGYINMGTANNGKYVALIPSIESETTIKFDSNSKTGSITFNRGIKEGRFYSNNSDALDIIAGAIPEGAIPGLFSVSDTKMVRFSKGNLYFNGTQWGFENAPRYGSYTNNAYTNVFNWGATGNTTNGGVDIYTYVTYTQGHVNLSTFEKTDWGGVVGTLGGCNRWYTPTMAEWEYVFGRENKYAEAKIANTYNGMMILPNDWSKPEGCSYTAGMAKGWTTNSYTNLQWDLMEASGVVFLPAAGYRLDTMINNAGDNGIYWSSTDYDAYEDHCYVMSFNPYGMGLSYSHRGYGQSVRLIYYVD